MKNLSPRAKQILSLIAQDEARKFGSLQILPEHVILGMLDMADGVGVKVIEKLGLDPEDLRHKLELFFSSDNNSPTLDDIPKSRRYRTLVDLADIESAALHNNYVGTEHLLLAAVREENSLVANFFAQANFSITDIRLMVMELQGENKSSVNNPAVGSIVDSVFRSLLGDDFADGLFTALDGKKSSAPQEPEKPAFSQPQQPRQSFLSEYSRDLTRAAVESKDDPVVGRDKEIRRVIQILCRRTKNNPVLTGEPGVGKTAIVEGLAQRIASGDVPSDLVRKRILSLDLAAMVAGTKYRGEFEERMKKMMRELQEDRNIILFIDELHTIIGAGGPEGTMDASNILKPALSRGEIQIIGATTTKEFRRHIEKDLALERRFQVVKVDEPDDHETEEILKGIKSKYEDFHRVVYDDDVIPAIVKLSRRYIPEKVLPDKAIDILDEAGASKKIQEEEIPSDFMELERGLQRLKEERNELLKSQNYESASVVRDKVMRLRRQLDMYSDMWQKNVFTKKKRVSVADIERIISEMTGIPVERLTSSEAERIIRMESELHNTVIGQDNAVSVISGAIRRARAGISSPKHPVGSFIFLGPTGVGKTQLAKALAKYLFGSEDSLIRIDMSDFMEKHTASRLVGAPPGYVGYEEGGVLTEKVRRNPYSVVLLDEIEKAHPDIFNLLLQLLEEGELSDNLGHTVNFRNTVVIMTSNAGARQITNEGRVGFGTEEAVLSYSEIKAGAMNEVKKLLSPELINRIDDIIVFDALSKSEVSKILEIQLKELEERLKEKGLSLDVKPKAKEYLVENGYNPAMGARPMRRLIRKEVEDPLAMEILSARLTKKSVVCIESAKGGLKIKIKNPEADDKVPQDYSGHIKCDVL